MRMRYLEVRASSWGDEGWVVGQWWLRHHSVRSKKKKKKFFFGTMRSWEIRLMRILFCLSWDLGLGWAGLGWQCFRGETKINNLTFLRLGMKYEVLFCFGPINTVWSFVLGQFLFYLSTIIDVHWTKRT